MDRNNRKQNTNNNFHQKIRNQTFTNRTQPVNRRNQRNNHQQNFEQISETDDSQPFSSNTAPNNRNKNIHASYWVLKGYCEKEAAAVVSAIIRCAQSRANGARDPMSLLQEEATNWKLLDKLFPNDTLVEEIKDLIMTEDRILKTVYLRNSNPVPTRPVSPINIDNNNSAVQSNITSGNQGHINIDMSKNQITLNKPATHQQQNQNDFEIHTEQHPALIKLFVGLMQLKSPMELNQQHISLGNKTYYINLQVKETALSKRTIQIQLDNTWIGSFFKAGFVMTKTKTFNDLNMNIWNWLFDYTGLPIWVEPSKDLSGYTITYPGPNNKDISYFLTTDHYFQIEPTAISVTSKNSTKTSVRFARFEYLMAQKVFGPILNGNFATRQEIDNVSQGVSAHFCFNCNVNHYPASCPVDEARKLNKQALNKMNNRDNKQTQSPTQTVMQVSESSIHMGYPHTNQGLPQYPMYFQNPYYSGPPQWSHNQPHITWNTSFPDVQQHSFKIPHSPIQILANPQKQVNTSQPAVQRKSSVEQREIIEIEDNAKHSVNAPQSPQPKLGISDDEYVPEIPPHQKESEEQISVDTLLKIQQGTYDSPEEKPKESFENNPAWIKFKEMKISSANRVNKMDYADAVYHLVSNTTGLTWKPKHKHVAYSCYHQIVEMLGILAEEPHLIKVATFEIVEQWQKDPRETSKEPVSAKHSKKLELPKKSTQSPHTSPVKSKANSLKELTNATINSSHQNSHHAEILANLNMKFPKEDANMLQRIAGEANYDLLLAIKLVNQAQLSRGKKPTRSPRKSPEKAPSKRVYRVIQHTPQPETPSNPEKDTNCTIQNTRESLPVSPTLPRKNNTVRNLNLYEGGSNQSQPI